MKSTEQNEGVIFDIINEYVSTQLAFSEAIFLSGSFANKGALLGSDVDIIVVSNLVQFPFSELAYYKSIKFHTHILPINISGIFESERNNRTSPYINMLFKSTILYEKLNTGKQLKELAKYYYEKGPAPITHQEYMHFKFQASNFLEDLNNDRSFSENFFSFYKFLDSLTFLMLLAGKKWPLSGKLRAQAIENSYPQFPIDLQTAVNKSIAESNVDGFLNFGNYYIKNIGGKIESFFSRNIPDRVYTNELKILFPLRSSNETYTEYSLFIREFIAKFAIVSEWMFLRLWDDSISKNDGYILSVPYEEATINDQMIPYLDMLKAKKSLRFDFIYPLNMQLNYCMNQDMYKELNSILHKISLENILPRTNPTNETSFQKSLFMFSRFLSSFKSHGCNVASFILFLKNTWLCSCLDHGAEMSIKMLQNSKSEIDDLLEKNLAAQQTVIFDIIDRSLKEDKNNNFFTEICRIIGSSNEENTMFKSASQVLERMIAAFYIHPKHKYYYAYIFDKYHKDLVTLFR